MRPALLVAVVSSALALAGCGSAEPPAGGSTSSDAAAATDASPAVDHADASPPVDHADAAPGDDAAQGEDAADASGLVLEKSSCASFLGGVPGFDQTECQLVVVPFAAVTPAWTPGAGARCDVTVQTLVAGTVSVHAVYLKGDPCSGTVVATAQDGRTASYAIVFDTTTP